MQNNQSFIPEFFPNWNFNFASFYLICPSLKEQEKMDLTTKIIKYKGRITFTISKESIIVIDNPNFFKIRENKQIIKDFNKIYFYDNNYIKKINIRRSGTKKIDSNQKVQKVIKMITINALNDEIDIFESKSLDYFFNKGLNVIGYEKNILCLFRKNKFKKKQELISYYFNNNSNWEENDVPFYHPKVPDNFSIFCSEFEYRQVMYHIKTEEYKKQLKQKKIREKEEFELKEEPEPPKKEFLCQICKLRYDNYLEHIKSSLHLNNKKKYKDAFTSIKNTFKRIVENNKDKNKIKNDFIDIESHIFSSTKEDSLPINEVNIKIIKKGKNNLEKIVEKNEENEKSQKVHNNNDNNISVKDILKILNSIEVNEKIINKKRKKNDRNIFKSDNNYIGDFKKVTKKIGYYSNLLDELK